MTDPTTLPDFKELADATYPHLSEDIRAEIARFGRVGWNLAKERRAPPAAPPGWRLVPIKATVNMEVAVMANIIGSDGAGGDYLHADWWDDVLAAAQAPPTAQATGWRDIELDPPGDDVNVILMWPYDEEHAVASWDGDRWRIQCCGQTACNFTHWMPLPLPPTTEPAAPRGEPASGGKPKIS